jgi:hypothetical protein
MDSIILINQSGEFSLILCWCLMGKPWAMTEKKEGCPCQPEYTSHYTVVGNNFLPVASGQNIPGDEIVIFTATLCAIVFDWKISLSFIQSAHQLQNARIILMLLFNEFAIASDRR